MNAWINPLTHISIAGLPSPFIYMDGVVFSRPVLIWFESQQQKIKSTTTIGSATKSVSQADDGGGGERSLVGEGEGRKESKMN